MRINLERMFARARCRVHSVYFHQLDELDEATYSLLVRSHRTTQKNLQSIKKRMAA